MLKISILMLHHHNLEQIFHSQDKNIVYINLELFKGYLSRNNGKKNFINKIVFIKKFNWSSFNKIN